MSTYMNEQHTAVPPYTPVFFRIQNYSYSSVFPLRTVRIPNDSYCELFVLPIFFQSWPFWYYLYYIIFLSFFFLNVHMVYCLGYEGFLFITFWYTKDSQSELYICMLHYGIPLITPMHYNLWEYHSLLQCMTPGTRVITHDIWIFPIV